MDKRRLSDHTTMCKQRNLHRIACLYVSSHIGSCEYPIVERRVSTSLEPELLERIWQEWQRDPPPGNWTGITDQGASLVERDWETIATWFIQHKRFFG